MTLVLGALLLLVIVGVVAMVPGRPSTPREQWRQLIKHGEPLGALASDLERLGGRFEHDEEADRLHVMLPERDGLCQRATIFGPTACFDALKPGDTARWSARCTLTPSPAPTRPAASHALNSPALELSWHGLVFIRGFDTLALPQETRASIGAIALSTLNHLDPDLPQARDVGALLFGAACEQITDQMQDEQVPLAMLWLRPDGALVCYWKVHTGARLTAVYGAPAHMSDAGVLLERAHQLGRALLDQLADVDEIQRALLTTRRFRASERRRWAALLAQEEPAVWPERLRALARHEGARDVVVLAMWWAHDPDAFLAWSQAEDHRTVDAACAAARGWPHPPWAEQVLLMVATRGIDALRLDAPDRPKLLATFGQVGQAEQIAALLEALHASGDDGVWDVLAGARLHPTNPWWAALSHDTQRALVADAYEAISTWCREGDPPWSLAHATLTPILQTRTAEDATRLTSVLGRHSASHPNLAAVLHGVLPLLPPPESPLTGALSLSDETPSGALSLTPDAGALSTLKDP